MSTKIEGSEFVNPYEPGTVAHFLVACARRLPPQAGTRKVDSWRSRDLRDGFQLTVKWHIKDVV